MTHDILRSDIELATRLRDDNRPDEEIILALVHRGVDAGQAAQVLDDLRNGRNASARLAPPLEFGLARRSRSRRASSRSGLSRSSPPAEAESLHEPPPPPSEPVPRREPGPPAAASGRKRSTAFWLIAAIVVALVIVAGMLAFFRRTPAAASASQDQHLPAAARVTPSPREAPAKLAAANLSPSPTALVLALQPDGLHLGGHLVSRDNALATVASLLGAAARTNQVRQTGALIYAYDHAGLLLYLQPGGRADSIVLDCEANGGANGTTSPFAGLLQIEDHTISPDTDAQTLTAIKTLGLKRPGAGDTIWGGRYQNLELVFAYLKSPRRLSLIEIDLK